MTAAVTAIVTVVIAGASQMCSQATVNARQTPILASPSANIAGSQMTRFITNPFRRFGRASDANRTSIPHVKWQVRHIVSDRSLAPASISFPYGLPGSR